MIWPGDVNNNGIVNGVDVLFLGIAYGNTGPARPGGNSDWNGQNIGDLWSQDFPGGTNFAYADCNGDGIVDEDDFEEAIKENLFLSHGDLTPDEYSTGAVGAAPQLRIVPQNNNVQTGELIVFDLLLGDEEIPAEDFYGIAVTLSYNDDFVFFDEWEFEDEDDAWYDPSGNNALYLDEEDENSNRIEVAITRTNQQVISGYGKIGEVSIVIEDIVFGLQDTLTLGVESIKLIDKNLNTLSAAGDSTFVIVSSPDQINNPNSHNTVSVFPNPGNGNYQITCTHPITGLELTDLSGRQASAKSSIQSGGFSATISLDKTFASNQIFFLKVFTEAGVIVKKIIFI